MNVFFLTNYPENLILFFIFKILLGTLIYGVLTSNFLHLTSNLTCPACYYKIDMSNNKCYVSVL